MTIEPKPVDGSEKPDLALAMQIGEYFHKEIENLEQRLGARISEAVNANAKTVGRMEELEAQFSTLKDDLNRRASDRADKDVAEARARYEIALQHKVGLDTQEKIDVSKMMEDRESAARRARADRWRAFWDKVTPGVASAMILSVVIPVWLALVILILVFILRALGIEVQLPT